MAAYEIPLSPRPQSLKIVLAGKTYALRVYYANVDQGGWLLDIADATGNPLVCGVPLVTGADLLEQYAYLGIGGRLFVLSDAGSEAVPTFENLGISSHLYFEPN